MTTNNTQLNTFKSIKSVKIDTVTTPEMWINSIKNPSTKIKDIIEELRTYHKGHPQYDSLKNKLPTICWNSTFNNSRSTTNLIDTTGLVFIDLDDCSFDIKELNTDKIYAQWKSVGNCGYSIIVKCDTINPINFKIQYLKIIEDLCLLKYYDKSCNDITRQNVLSSDTELFYNPDCLSFSFSDDIVIEEEDINDKLVLNLEKRDNNSPKLNLLFSNVSMVVSEIEFVDKNWYVNWDGIKVVVCTCIPNTIGEGGRQGALLSYCNNLVVLNPTATEEEIFHLMLRVNTIMCKVPVTGDRVKNVVKSIFKYKYNNTLKPIYTTRKIFFDPEVKYSKEDKFEIVNKLMSEKRSGDSKSKLYDIIEQWDFSTYGKITKAKIVKGNPISGKTVDKYWSNFKEYVSELNNQFKINMKLYEN